MDEGRKRVLAILTAILVSPRLKDWAWDGRTGSPACEGFVMTALGVAERILHIIDRKFQPAKAPETASVKDGPVPHSPKSSAT